MGNSGSSFDKRFEKWTLNWALTFLIVWTALFTAGILGTIKYAKSGDDVGIGMGVVNTSLGIIGIVLGCQMVHAVVRRLIAKSRAAL